IATATDCLELARESTEPEERLFYYSAAEALGADGPELWRERHTALAQLSEPELAYLNARNGPWCDTAVLAELSDQLRRSNAAPGDIPDTVESLDAIYMVR